MDSAIRQYTLLVRAQSLWGLEMAANADLLKTRAGELVSAANIFALSSYTTVSTRIPFVANIAPAQWDFFVTVGSVFIAVSRLNRVDLRDVSFDSISEVVAQKLTAWQSEAHAAFENCQVFFDRTYDSLSGSQEYYGPNRAFLASDSVGSWIVWNLLSRAPDNSAELQLVRTIGVLVTHTFSMWWELD